MSDSSSSATAPHYVLLVLVAYLYCAASMAVVGLVVPMIDVLAQARHVAPSSIGVSISWFSLPAALGSFAFGMVVDRIGVKRAFAVSGGLILAGDIVVLSLPGLAAFRCGLLLAGCGYAFVNTACPVLFMQYLPEESQRRRALAFWSTYAPVGYSLGLLAAVPFLHSGNWRGAWHGHAALSVLAVVGILFFVRSLRPVSTRPAAATAVVGAPRPRMQFSGFALLPILLLGVAVCLPNGLAYGTSLIAPHYLADTHHISLEASSATVAIVKFCVMLAGGFVISLCTSSETRAMRMFLVMAAVGFGAQVALMLPGSSTFVAIGGLLIWSFAYSGLSGAAMAMLPNVATDVRHRGAVTATVSQFSSVSSVLIPYVFFSIKPWNEILLLETGMLVVATASMLLLRGRLKLQSPASPGLARSCHVTCSVIERSDEQRGCELQKASFSTRSDRACGMAVFPVSAEFPPD